MRKQKTEGNLNQVSLFQFRELNKILCPTNHCPWNTFDVFMQIENHLSMLYERGWKITERNCLESYSLKTLLEWF